MLLKIILITVIAGPMQYLHGSALSISFHLEERRSTTSATHRQNRSGRHMPLGRELCISFLELRTVLSAAGVLCSELAGVMSRWWPVILLYSRKVDEEQLSVKIPFSSWEVANICALFSVHCDYPGRMVEVHMMIVSKFLIPLVLGFLFGWVFLGGRGVLGLGFFGCWGFGICFGVLFCFF